MEQVNRIEQFSLVQNEGLELFKKKNADYLSGSLFLFKSQDDDL
jgi:hypothetical protein